MTRVRAAGALPAAPRPQGLCLQAPGGHLPAAVAWAGGLCGFFLMIALPDFGLEHPLPLPCPPPSLFVFLLGGIALLALLQHGHLPSDRVAMGLVAWVGLILALTLVGLAETGFDASALEPFKNRLYALICLLSAFTLARVPEGRRALIGTFFLALLVDLAFQAYEMLHPSTFSEVHGRAAGLFQNPNASAGALGSVLLALWSELPRKSRGVLFAATTLGILGTFSRASMSGWLLVGVLGIPLGLWKGRQGSIWLFILLVALAGLLACIQSGLLETLHWEALNGNTLNRIRFGVGDGSTLERVTIARLGWHKVAEAPWLGYGLAAPFRFMSQGTHNMYLFNWVEYGILGVLLLPTLLLPLAKGQAHDRLFLLFSLWQGCFNHNVLDSRYFLLPLGLLLASLPPGRQRAKPAVVP